MSPFLHCYTIHQGLKLRFRFRAFGPLRYARITIDHATGRGRGTGFACFWNKEDADKALAQSDVLKAETMGAPSSASAAVSVLPPLALDWVLICHVMLSEKEEPFQTSITPHAGPLVVDGEDPCPAWAHT